jgi:hypothetical protein
LPAPQGLLCRMSTCRCRSPPALVSRLAGLDGGVVDVAKMHTRAAWAAGLGLVMTQIIIVTARMRHDDCGAGVDITSAPKWEVDFQCHSAAALAERRPKAVTAAWLPGCGPGALGACPMLCL